MNKKLIIIILLVIVITGGIYIFFNRNNDEETNAVNSENNVNSENTEKTDVENSNQPEDNLNQNTETTNSNPTNVEVNENIDNNNNQINGSIVKEVSPSGFMGSSLYRVVLYSNKEVYVEKFDGSGYEKENLISKELIAKNVNTIKNAKDEEHYGEVFVKGGERVSTNYGWINFE